jgi:uncharacterized membrane protein
MMVALYHAIMWAGSFWCHQMPGRSPHIFGVQLPLCWRCTGIAVGTLILVLSLIKRKRLPDLSISLPFAMLMPFDVFSAMLGLWSGQNAIRFFTGILWGVFGTVVVLRVLVWVVDELRRVRCCAPWNTRSALGALRAITARKRFALLTDH